MNEWVHLLIYRLANSWLILAVDNNYLMRSLAGLGMFLTVSLKLRNYLLAIDSTSYFTLGYVLLDKMVITLLPNY